MLFFFFKQKTAYEIGVRLVGSEMCIRDRLVITNITASTIRRIPNKPVITCVKNKIAIATATSILITWSIIPMFFVIFFFYYQIVIHLLRDCLPFSYN